MREGTKRLLEVPHGLAVGRSRHGLLPRLPAIRQGLGPHLAPEGMIGQPFHLLGHLISGKRLQGRDDPGMECPPPLLEQRLIGHLLGEGVLEGVLYIGEEARLVEKLSRLQMGEAQAERLLRHVGYGLQEREGHLRANDRGGLQELFFLRWQPVDARRQDRLHCGRHLDTQQCHGQAIHPRLADQHLRFPQRAHALFQEERVPLGALDQALCERCETRIVPEEALQHGCGASGRQRVESELGVVGLRAPAVLILGAIVDQQEQTGASPPTRGTTNVTSAGCTPP
jgi:hypothetical protein